MAADKMENITWNAQLQMVHYCKYQSRIVMMIMVVMMMMVVMIMK